MRIVKSMRQSTGKVVHAFLISSNNARRQNSEANHSSDIGSGGGGGLVFAGAVVAAQDHASLVKGPFKTGPDVTKACLQCHEQQAKDFMKTRHWTWNLNQEVP
ncbi:MAG: hypothetical protein AAB299_00045, partial [Thermodesulfobacteriota bacterium]